MIIKKSITILLMICMIISITIFPASADTIETESMGDLIAESLVLPQSVQKVYLGDNKRYRFTDLMIVKDGITYLPVRMAFTGWDGNEVNINGINTFVETFMEEPSIAISVNYKDSNGNNVNKGISINWFEPEKIDQLNLGIEPDDEKYRNYRAAGKAASSRGTGVMFYRKAGAKIDSIKVGNEEIPVYEPVLDRDNGIAFRGFEDLDGEPIIQTLDNKGSGRVYIPINQFNHMIQYLIGDKDYSVGRP